MALLLELLEKNPEPSSGELSHMAPVGLRFFQRSCCWCLETPGRGSHVHLTGLLASCQLSLLAAHLKYSATEMIGQGLWLVELYWDSIYVYLSILCITYFCFIHT
jgi:hypothetical protein